MIVFFNPRSTTPGKQTAPLSLLALAAALDRDESWVLVDGNLDPDPARTIAEHCCRRGTTCVLAVTVMPGPQLTQAVRVCRDVRDRAPHVHIVWGGYVATQHHDAVLGAPYVDFVVRSQGERPFLQLVETLRRGGALSEVPSLSWKSSGQVVHNPLGPMVPLDDLPRLPYDRVAMEPYIHANYLGRRTALHNTSFGCPFSCNFCAVVAMSHRHWLAHSPARVESDVRHLVDSFGVDAVQMADMDFFISESRARETAQRIEPLGVAWWALGRVDALMRYRDATWTALRRSGLRMVFSGAETGSDATLARMNKGGRASTKMAIDLAARMRTYGIVPEFSFVLGSPPDPIGDMHDTSKFIRRVKQVNPATEIIMYVYTPVPGENAMVEGAEQAGFQFPATLDEWASPEWQQFAMRRGDTVPWSTRRVRRRVRSFERVINAFYPTVTDTRLTGSRRLVLKAASAWRYHLRWYAGSFELRALHRLMQYQRPETTGF